MAQPQAKRVPGIHVVYNAEPTPSRFHASNAFYRGIMGPVRSGKSVCCSMELQRRIKEQAPGPDGYRRTRMAIVRNTYRELEDTTLKTWLQWFPPEYFGRFNYRSMTHQIEYGDVKSEVMFRALDRPADVAKLLSMEITGAWVNESREVIKAVIDPLGDRVGQYPSKADGGCTWRGVIMDTNPPDTSHWWYKAAEEDTPHDWEFFRQPGALTEIGEKKYVINPDAENIHNLNEGDDYYLTRVHGKSTDYIRVYYCAQYGFVQDGKPVHPEYADSTHCSEHALFPVKGRTIVVGLDFGLTPAASFNQQQPSGQWITFDELTTGRLGVKRFGERLLGPKLNEYSAQGFEIELWGDPSGSDEVQTDESTCFQILAALGIDAKPCHTNDPTIRREALAGPMSRLIDGKPGWLIDKRCTMIRKGCAGGFYYKRLQVRGDTRYHLKPFKNEYSHPVEATEYALLGAGEGKAIVRKPVKEYHPPPRIVTPRGWMA